METEEEQPNQEQLVEEQPDEEADDMVINMTRNVRYKMDQDGLMARER